MNFEGIILDDRYKLIRKLGAGGMAEVFLADDLKEKIQVAVKIMPPGDDSKNDYVLRFQREFKVCAALNHPNIVKMYTCGQTPDKSSWYYAMELFNCRDLEQVLKDQRILSAEDTLRVAVPMAQGFRHYHKNGIVHRDLKPSNIMVEKSGRIVIMDFGLVHDPSRTQLTKTGMIVGTPIYMSPELLTGVKPDRRSDIFQLGSILHECLCGTPAFYGKNLQEVASKIIYGDYTPVRKKNPAVPRDWEIFLLNCLAKKPENRYEDGDEVLKDLIKLSKGTPLILLGERPVKIAKIPPETNPAKASGSDGTESNSAVTENTCHSEPLTDSVQKNSNKAHKTHKASRRSDDPKTSLPDYKTRQSCKVIAFFLTTAIICLLISFPYLFPENEGSTLVITDLKATGGKNSGAIFFTSPDKVLKPQFAVSLNGDDNSSEDVSKHLTFSSVQIKPFNDSNNRKVFSHSVIVKGLQFDSKYSIALITDNKGGKTLPRSFSTRGKNLEQHFQLSYDGSLIITVDDNLPFTCEVVGNGIQFSGEPAYEAGRHYIKGRLTIPFDSLINNYPISYALKSIDGELLQSSQRGQDLLERILDGVYAEFIKSREVSESSGKIYVPFFSKWDFKGKENWLFKKNSTNFIKARDEDGKDKLHKIFWQEIEEKLIQDFQWYRTLCPLFPGLHKFIESEKLSWQFRQKLAMALIGIELIQGASVSYRVPDNKLWTGFISPQSRPFRFGPESALPSADITITGIPALQILHNDQIPIHLVHDMSSPVNYEKLHKSVLLPFLSAHELNFEIKDDPALFKKAEIALDFRSTGNPAMVALMHLNDDRFIASVRPTRKHFVDFHESWHPQKNFDTILVRSYAENQLVSIGQVIDGSADDDLKVALPKFKETIISMDQNLPHIAGVSLYHPVPLEVLNKGTNKLKIEVISGPSALPKPLIYKTVRLIMSR
jgi:serine/threonine protein kinase